MQLRYKTHGWGQSSTSRAPPRARGARRQTVGRARASSVRHAGTCVALNHLLWQKMDFVLPTSVPAGGIPWQKVLPPLIPRLNGTYGQYNWSPSLLMPETDHTSSAEVNCDDSGFTVQVDVKHFKPEDLMVKVIGDFVEVQGKHEEKKQDGAGVTTRQFNRRYRIPKGVDTMALESAVSPDGILFISAPMLQTECPRVLT
uniref:Heat shock protein, alpha-crystallin-related, b6 n=2 Tax=Gasterosteus aculeatus aculeatus TaxID=481459 RepID=G3NXN5_GASAC